MQFFENRLTRLALVMYCYNRSFNEASHDLSDFLQFMEKSFSIFDQEHREEKIKVNEKKLMEIFNKREDKKEIIHITIQKFYNKPINLLDRVLLIIIECAITELYMEVNTKILAKEYLFISDFFNVNSKLFNGIFHNVSEEYIEKNNNIDS